MSNFKPSNTPNKTVIRKETTGGKFTTIHTSVLHDKRLTGNTFRVLASILSDADHFRVSVSGLEKRLGISENTIRASFQQLQEFGYMQIKRNNYNQYNHYIISEYGNLVAIIEDDGVIVPVVAEPAVVEPTVQTNKNAELLAEYLGTIVQYLDYGDTQTELTKLHNQFMDEAGNFDFYPFKYRVDKIILQIQKDLYAMCFSITQIKAGSKKAVKEYSNWLKDEVFNKRSVEFDYEKKWVYMKVQHRVFKTDWETEQADRREDGWD